MGVVTSRAELSEVRFEAEHEPNTDHTRWKSDSPGEAA